MESIVITVLLHRTTFQFNFMRNKKGLKKGITRKFVNYLFVSIIFLL